MRVRLNAYDGAANARGASLDVSVGYTHPLIKILAPIKAYCTPRRLMTGVVFSAVLLGLWRAHDAGWVSDDNPLVAAGLFLKGGLIFDLRSPRVWVLFAFIPLMWRLLPEGWRLAVFPFVGHLMFLQLSHWAMTIVTAGLNAFTIDVLSGIQGI
ncbi:MAG: hypothetical protein AAF224_04800 [Pseudomonadota bacterium]